MVGRTRSLALVSGVINNMHNIPMAGLLNAVATPYLVRRRHQSQDNVIVIDVRGGEGRDVIVS